MNSADLFLKPSVQTGKTNVSDRSLEQTIKALIQQEGLPETYAQTVEQTILPLADHILALHDAEKRPVVVGIHGAQGTGKSTLTLFLREILSRHLNCPTANFSLDDIYLTRAERQDLAEQIHPLFKTRGVPGTHDVALGQRVLDQLRSAGPDDRTAIPLFDKSRDDRVPTDAWPDFLGPAEVILIEGWCLGARPEDEQALGSPINRLEADEDPHGTWRAYVNEQLKGEYRDFFSQIDCLVMLKAPSMKCVLEWRSLQEKKLARKTRGAPEEGGAGTDAQALRIMNDDEVARFVMHYERVTRACLAEMPCRADVLINVAEDHSLGLPQFRAD
jgi:D-glycerate 3-kinase